MARLTGCLKNTLNKRNIWIVLMPMMILSLAIMLSACGEKDKNKEAEKEKEYTTVAHVDFPIRNIKTLNPVVSKDEDTYFISRLFYDGLFEMDDTMTPVANLALDYQFNKDGDSVTINLVETNFHDGKSFNADDVKFTISAMKAADKACPYYSLMKKISYAETKGKRKVKIHFNSKNDRSLAMLTFPILPKHRYDGIYDIIGKKGKFRPVGTGKYRYKSFKNEKTLKLAAYDGYHGDKAENSVTFTVCDGGSTYQLVEASSLSGLVSTEPDRETKVDQKEQKMIDFPANEVEFLGFNFNKDDTNKKKVRQAYAYAIDTNTLIEQAFTNSGYSIDTLYYPGYLGTESSGDAYQYNYGKAKALLKEEGYEKRGKDKYLSTEGGRTLSANILVNSDNKQRVEVANMVKNRLRALGVYATTTKYQTKYYKKALKGGNFDIYVGAIRYDQAMDMREILDGEKQEPEKKKGKYRQETEKKEEVDEDEDLDIDEDEDTEKKKTPQNTEKTNLAKKPTNSNFIRYYNEDLNKKLEKIMSGYSIEENKETLIKIKEILIEELPYYCLLQRSYGVIQASSVEGEMHPLFDNYYRGIGHLKCKFEVEEEKQEE